MRDPDTKTKTVSKLFHTVDCPYCGKHLESEYIKQLNYNYKNHVECCKSNPKNIPGGDDENK